MVQSPTLRWSVCILFFLGSLVDVAGARSRFDVLSPLLKTFRNRKRQGGTPGPVPSSSSPSTAGYPGLGPCVWASTNPWEGCGLNNGGELGYNASNCNIPTTNVEGLQAPYKNCVAIAWFKFEDWANSEYLASTPSIPLSSNYNYALSITANVIMNWVDVYNGKSGTSNYDKVASQTVNNKSTIFSFQLSRDGILHADIKYDYGHPSGNVTLWQQPKDLNSVASYASLQSLSSSTSQSYPLVSTTYLITTGTVPLISIGANSSIPSTLQSSMTTSSYDALLVNLNSTASLPSLITATMNSTTMNSTTMSSTAMNSTTMSSTAMNSTTMSSTAMNSTTMSSAAMNSTIMSSIIMNSTIISSTAMNSTIMSSTIMNSTIISSTAMNSTMLMASPTAPANLSSNLTASAFAVYTPYGNSANSTAVPRATISRFEPIAITSNSSTRPLFTAANSTTIITSRPDPSTRRANLTTTIRSPLPSNSSVRAPIIEPTSSSRTVVVARNSSAIVPSRPSSTLAVSTFYNSTIAPSSSPSRPTPSRQLTSRFLPADPPSTSTPAPPIASASSTSAVPVGIPLWGQCGPNIGQVCASGAECICKDPWWSQCRIQIDGLWTPRGSNWECSGPSARADEQATTVATAPSNAPAAAPAATGLILPLWYQCGPGIQGTCAQGTECICQNSFYSQCRVPVNGNWAGGYNWECNSPGQVPPAS